MSHHLKVAKSQQQQPKKPSGSQEKSAMERKAIANFWLSLDLGDRKKILRVEKYELLKRIKEKHRHICSCTVCGRKRAVIDREVERLYDQYCDELEMRGQKGISAIPSHTKATTTPRPALPTTVPAVKRKNSKSTDPSTASNPPAIEVTTEGAKKLEDKSNKDDLQSVDDDYSDIDDESLVPDAKSEEYISWNFGRNLLVVHGKISVSDDWLKEYGTQIVDLFYKFEQNDDTADSLEVMMIGATNHHKTHRTHRKTSTTTTTTTTTTMNGPNFPAPPLHATAMLQQGAIPMPAMPNTVVTTTTVVTAHQIQQQVPPNIHAVKQHVLEHLPAMAVANSNHLHHHHHHHAHHHHHNHKDQQQPAVVPQQPAVVPPQQQQQNNTIVSHPNPTPNTPHKQQQPKTVVPNNSDDADDNEDDMSSGQEDYEEDEYNSEYEEGDEEGEDDEEGDEEEEVCKTIFLRNFCFTGG